LRMISNEKILDGYYQDFSFQQPPLYTLSMYIVKPFIPNYYMGFGIYCFIQIIMMVGMFTYFAYWLLKKNVSSFIVTLIIIFCGTFRLYPLYGVSLWKDTTFSIAFFLYCLIYIDIVIDIIKGKIQLKNIVLFSMFSVFTVFLRNNAKYILVACLIALIFLDSKKMCHNIREGKNNNYRLLITSQLLIIVFSIAIPPIVRLSLQVEKEHFAENIAIPIQQVARVVCVDGRITEEQKKLIEKVLPFDNIKKDYRALIVDPIKWDSKFDNKYLENHKLDFLKLWVSLFFRNPREYMQAYLLQTSGFWSFNVCSLREGYHSAINFESLNDKVQIKNVINDKYGINIQESMLALNKYSGGLFFWIYLASMLVSWRVNSKKYIICFLPAFFLWGTIMIATPMGQSLRYVYILVLMLPLDFVLPSIISDVDLKE
ncbi:MAG: DUF6020 family protein, partial [Clostridia bacterium]|nr:DUF6020 family protein [Clostridia bacterium]